MGDASGPLAHVLEYTAAPARRQGEGWAEEACLRVVRGEQVETLRGQDLFGYLKQKVRGGSMWLRGAIWCCGTRWW
jgi:hypothetical protein